MRRRVPPLAWGFGAAIAVLVVGALLPLGKMTHFGQWENHCQEAPLWKGISQLPSHRREAQSDDEFWGCQEGNLTNAGILFLIAGLVGCTAGWFSRSRIPPMEAADYQDSSGGAVTDGRLGPPVF
jgi:hypothetical protein